MKSVDYTHVLVTTETDLDGYKGQIIGCLWGRKPGEHGKAREAFFFI